MGEQWTALIVDDERHLRADVALVLKGAGALVLEAGSVNEAFAALIDTQVDLVLVAHVVKGAPGLPLLEQLRSEGERPIPILVTTREAASDGSEAFDRGADDYLRLPIPASELAARCHRLLRHYARQRRFEGEAQKLHELSVTDGLTKVANQRSFRGRLAEEFRRAERYDDPLALVLCDLDQFKAINERFGHSMGDLVLRATADIFHEAVRETDFVARYGEEVFAVLLPKTHLAGALTVAERIALDLRAQRVGPAEVPIQARFGVSSFPSRGIRCADELLRTAGEALQGAKGQGRHRIRLYQSTRAPVTPS